MAEWLCREQLANKEWKNTERKGSAARRLVLTTCMLHAEAIDEVHATISTMPCVATYQQLHLVQQPLQGTVYYATLTLRQKKKVL